MQKCLRSVKLTTTVILFLDQKISNKWVLFNSQVGGPVQQTIALIDLRRSLTTHFESY